MDENHFTSPGAPGAQGGRDAAAGPDAGRPSAGPENGPRVGWDQVRDLRSLSRPTSGRMVGGVATGVARHLDVDPLLIRVAFAVLTFFGGAGVLLYGALWLLMPTDGDARAILHLDARSRQIAVVGAAALAALTMLGATWGSWSPPWPLVLVALLLVVFFSRRQPNAGFSTGVPGVARPSAPAQHPASAPAQYAAQFPAQHPAQGSGTGQAAPEAGVEVTRPVALDQPAPHWSEAAATTPDSPATPETPYVAPTPTSYAWQHPGPGTGQHPGAAAGAVPPYLPPTHVAPAYPSQPPQNPRKRGPVLFWFTLALIVLGIGVLATAEVAGTAVHDSAYPALALAITSVMLLVGAFWGRAGGLIALGLVAGVTTLGATLDRTWDDDHTTITPLVASSVPDRHEFGAGSVVLDLSQIEDLTALDGRRIVVKGSVGNIELIVPDTLGVDLDAEVSGPGNISDFEGNDRGGIGITQSAGFHSGIDTASVSIDLELAVGDISMHRVAAPERTAPEDADAPTGADTATDTPTESREGDQR